ncbi:hypothetical protein ACWEN6_13605 [Sphaerisporangium sp. NPDC004334]
MPAALRGTVRTAAIQISSTASVSAPSGLTPGDVLLAVQLTGAGSTSGIGTPTGGSSWGTPLLSATGSGCAARLFGKVAGTGEPGTYTFSRSDVEDHLILLLAISEAATTGVVASSTTNNDTLITTPGVTPAGADSLEVRFALGELLAGSGPSWSQPGGWTERADYNFGGSLTGCCATRSLSSAAATSAVEFTCSNVVNGIAFTAAVPSMALPRPPLLSAQAALRGSLW